MTENPHGLTDDDRERTNRIIDEADRDLRAAFRADDTEAVEEMTRPVEHDCEAVVEDDGTCFYCGRKVR